MLLSVLVGDSVVVINCLLLPPLCVWFVLGHCFVV